MGNEILRKTTTLALNLSRRKLRFLQEFLAGKDGEPQRAKERSRRRKIGGERRGEGLINVLAMINGLGAAITNWLCF